MAVALTPQVITVDGIEPTYEAANNANTVPNTGREYAHVKNYSGGNLTITFDTPGQISGLEIENKEVIIPNGEEWMIGPFPTDVYGTTLTITYSTTTSVTIAILCATAKLV